MPESPTVMDLEVLGRLTLRLDTAAKTDTGKRGELQAYISGSTIRLRMFDDAAGAWREVSLT